MDSQVLLPDVSSANNDHLEKDLEGQTEVIEVDIDTFKWWELACLCVGFLASTYQLFVTNVIDVVFTEVHKNIIDETELLSSVSLAGPIVGMILFGCLCDRFGSHKIFVLTGIIQLLGGAASSLLPDSTSVGANQLWSAIAVCRFFVGIGVGGEYPTIALLTAEKSTEENRGFFMALIMTMQGIGLVLAPFVVWCLLQLNIPLDWIWRVSFAIGTVLQILVVIPRMYFTPTDFWIENYNYSKKPFRQWISATKDILRKYIWKLLGAGLSWLLFDITFYGNTFLKDDVSQIIGLKGGSSIRSSLSNLTEFSMIIAAIGIPGYIISIFLIDRIGRRKLQIVGFLFMLLTYMAVGLALSVISSIIPLFLTLYGLTFFVSNLGPNTITFIVATEIFPTEIRGTAHGICAALGKLGAIIGVVAFQPVAQEYGNNVLFIACAIVAFFGIGCTYGFIPEKMGKPLKSFRQRKDSIHKLLIDQDSDSIFG